MSNKIFPLNLAKPTEELKKLIAEYPDYPIVVVADEYAAPDFLYTWMYCSDISFSVSKILDCEAVCKDEHVYIDRDELLEDMSEYLSEEYPDMPEEELNKLIDTKVSEYDEYWKDVIVIWASN